MTTNSKGSGIATTGYPVSADQRVAKASLTEQISLFARFWAAL